MHDRFDGTKYELVDADRVHIDGIRLSRSRVGALDVWIERDASGERFMHTIMVDGSASGVGAEVYSDTCYILRNKMTGRHLFLEQNSRGYYLQSEAFFGADMYAGEEAADVAAWLTSQGGGDALG